MNGSMMDYKIILKNTFVHVVEAIGDEDFPSEEGGKLRRQTSAPASLSDLSNRSVDGGSTLSSGTVDSTLVHPPATGSQPTRATEDTADWADVSSDTESFDESGSTNLESHEGREEGKGSAHGDAAKPDYKRSRRPCKGKRRRYRNLVGRVEDKIRMDPKGFDIEAVEKGLPPSVLQDTKGCTKLMDRLKRLLEEELRKDPGDSPDSTSPGIALGRMPPQRACPRSSAPSSAGQSQAPTPTARRTAAEGPVWRPKMSL